VYEIGAGASWVHRNQPQRLKKLLTAWIMNPAHHTRHIKPVASDLGGHYILVLVLRYGRKRIRLFDACTPEHVFVDAVPYHCSAAKVCGQQTEGVGVHIQNGHTVTFPGERSR